MSKILTEIRYMDQLVEQVKDIKTEDLSDDKSLSNTSTKIVEDQKIYLWIRLYLNEEELNIKIGDEITIRYTQSDEELKTKFFSYDKKGMGNKESPLYNESVVDYVTEDDKKVLCLMIDEKIINNNTDIPFIRTLFKTGHFYEYQLVKRDELLFINDKNGVVLDYYDCDF